MAFDTFRRWVAVTSRFEFMWTVLSLVAGVASLFALFAYKPADIGQFGRWDAARAARDHQIMLQKLVEASDFRRNAEAQLDTLRRELNATRSELAHVRAVGATKAGMSSAFAENVAVLDLAVQNVDARTQRLDSRVTDTDVRLKQIETAIVADPQKALTVPLLRRDLDSLQQQIVRDVAAINAENSRAYDLMKWLIGLMAIVSFSLIGTAVSGVFKREESSKKGSGAGERTER